jgi:CelD/BcsL family acetyltransferase involved in cellulose biosynthesis
MNTDGIKAVVLRGFDDPLVTPNEWDRLLRSGATDTVFLTRDYQRVWWQSFGRGELLLTAGLRAGRVVALAPLYADGGMVFFVGSGGSDYLDFVGNTDDLHVLCEMLDVARRQAPGFLGYRFYHVPDSSPSGTRLRDVANRLGLKCYDEGEMVAPALELDAPPGAGKAAAEKKGLVRDERFLRREGPVAIFHVRDAASIAAQLDCFFRQHQDRWASTATPSLFCDPKQRAFFRRLAEVGVAADWLRFTRLDWNGRPIAYHFGFGYRKVFVYYKPSYCLEHARRSPGSVLLRQLLVAALDEGARVFDFGLGDEGYKHRFANRVHRVRTWGLYPAANV